MKAYPPTSCSCLQGLRESVPPNFPYFYVQFGWGSGYVHVIDDEQKFDPTFGRQIMVGGCSRQVMVGGCSRQVMVDSCSRQTQAGEAVTGVVVVTCCEGPGPHEQSRDELLQSDVPSPAWLAPPLQPPLPPRHTSACGAHIVAGRPAPPPPPPSPTFHLTHTYPPPLQVGLLQLPAEEMHRRAKTESLATQQQWAREFTLMWGPHDWTKQLD